MKRSPLWPVLGGVLAGVVAYLIAASVTANDHSAGDWRNGSARFVWFVTTLAAVGGYILTSFVTRGAKLHRDGFTLTYRPIAPTAVSYREMSTITVDDLLAALRDVGYQPAAAACRIDGERVNGPVDGSSALAGANLAVTDPSVRGYVRLQLPIAQAGARQAMGLVEIWSPGGHATEELALFVLRALDGLVGNLSATREGSALSEDPIATMTAHLPTRRA